MKTFTLATVLCITDGTLLTDIGNVYEILDYLTGVNLYTHQLIRASEIARPWILESYPELELIKADEQWSVDVLMQWLKEITDIYGNQFALEPLPTGRYEAMDPIVELINMRNK